MESCVVVGGDLVGDKVAAVVVVVVVVVRPSHQRSIQHLLVRINDPSLPGEIKEKRMKKTTVFNCKPHDLWIGSWVVEGVPVALLRHIGT